MSSLHTNFLKMLPHVSHYPDFFYVKICFLKLQKTSSLLKHHQIVSSKFQTIPNSSLSKHALTEYPFKIPPEQELHTNTSLSIQRCFLLKITSSVSGLTRFVSKSGVQMVKEGGLILSSPKKQRHRAAIEREFLLRSRPWGPPEVSTGPRLPAPPSAHLGGPISSSRGEALWR